MAELRVALAEERGARGRTEAELGSVRRAHGQMQALLAETKELLQRLLAASEPRPRPRRSRRPPPRCPEPVAGPRRPPCRRARPPGIATA